MRQHQFVDTFNGGMFLCCYWPCKMCILVCLFGAVCFRLLFRADACLLLPKPFFNRYVFKVTTLFIQRKQFHFASNVNLSFPEKKKKRKTSIHFLYHRVHRQGTRCGLCIGAPHHCALAALFSSTVEPCYLVNRGGRQSVRLTKCVTVSRQYFRPTHMGPVHPS